MLPLEKLSARVGRIWKFGKVSFESSSGKAEIATAKKQPSEMPRASEEELRAIFELTAVGIIVADPLTGRFVCVNRRFCEITGYTTEALLQMNVCDVTHPDDRERDRASFQSVLDGQQDQWEIEKRYLRKDDSVVWVRVTGTLLRDAERGPYRAMAEVRDITRERETAQALRESEERTRLAMQAGRMFAFEWSPLTDEVKRSHDCADMTGSSVDATRELGKDSFKRVHPEDQGRLRQTIRSLTPANDTYEIQYRVIRPDGKIATFQQSGRAFFDNGAAMIRLIG